jgi:DNA helicase IV
VAEHLATPAGWQLAELRLGYRSPADVIELAARLLPLAAPQVTAPEAVRSRRGGVAIVSAPAGVPTRAAEEAASLAKEYASVAVITTDVDAVETATRALGVDAGRADSGGLERPVALVSAREAKGLEFDAVVVADPAAIVASAPDEQRGLRLLYIALTRPTKALTVVHADDLPGPLR